MSRTTDRLGCPLEASSKDLVDLLDEATLELVGWFGDPIATIDKALARDPNFFLGQIFRGVLNLLMGLLKSPPVRECMEVCRKAGPMLSIWREKKHMEAFLKFQAGDMKGSSAVWRAICVEHPNDMLAVKFLHDMSFFLGDSKEIRAGIARVFPVWKKDHSGDVLYSYLMGMYAFGLEEDNMYREAEHMGKEALARNQRDPWAVHAVAHVMEMEGRQKDGIEWLQTTRPNWKDCGGLAVHNSWHKALYHLEFNQEGEVWNIYDNWMRQTKSDSLFDLVDCSSLLFRCEMQGLDVGDRWDDVMESWSGHLNTRSLVFNDVHAMMNAIGCKKPALAQSLMGSMKSYAAQTPPTTQSKITSKVGLALAEAVMNWGTQDYDKVVDNILPIRHRIQSIGGSHAQRDMLNIMLIQASIKADNNKLASSLLCERLEAKQSQVQAWKWNAGVLTKLGKMEMAQEAQEKAEHYLK